MIGLLKIDTDGGLKTVVLVNGKSFRWIFYRDITII